MLIQKLPHLRIDQYLSLTCLILCFSLAPSLLIAPDFEFDLQAKQPQLPALIETFEYPEISEQVIQPDISAKAAIVVDVSTGKVLYAKNEHQRLPQASLTKLMSAIVADKHFPYDQVLTVQGEEKTVGNRMKLLANEQITVENLLKGLLIFSGNDAAYVLANNHPNGYQAFVQEMNDTAQELKLENTSYTNPAGLDDVNQYSSAWDLAILTQVVMTKPELRRSLGTRFASVSSADGIYQHPLYTTNQLLYNTEGMMGGKTGSTDLAGECLVTQVKRNDHTVVTVVLGSNDRFADTKSLIEWTYANYRWTSLPTPQYNEVDIY